MNMRQAMKIVKEECARHTGDVREALEIATGVMEKHLARRDRVAAKRKDE